MQLIITQPVFEWIFGAVGVLFAIILVLVVVGLIYIVSLLKLAREKSNDIAETIDTVRGSVRDTTEAFDSARDNVAQFVGAAVSVGTIGKVIGAIRNAWQGQPVSLADDEDDIFADIAIGKKHSTKQRSQNG